MSPRQPRRQRPRTLQVYLACEIPDRPILPGRRYMIRMTYCWPELSRVGVAEEGYEVRQRLPNSPARPAYSHETVDVWWEQVPEEMAESLRACGYDIEEWEGFTPAAPLVREPVIVSREQLRLVPMRRRSSSL